MNAERNKLLLLAIDDIFAYLQEVTDRLEQIVDVLISEHDMPVGNNVIKIKDEKII